MLLDFARQRKKKLYKHTQWVTNSALMAESLGKVGRNLRQLPHEFARHVHFVVGLVVFPAVYPPAFCHAVLVGLKDHMLHRGSLSALDCYSSGPVPVDSNSPTTEEEFARELAKLYDDVIYDNVSGEALPALLVNKARSEERKWADHIGLYRKVPRGWARSRGLVPISTRCVDVNKGSPSNPKVRSRICARELKCKTKQTILAHGVFSATPPWEMIKASLSLLVTDDIPCGSESLRGEELELGIFDISRAHLWRRPTNIFA